jgi:hypothetical protein
MNKSLMADIAESSSTETDIDELDYDVKEATIPRAAEWVELDIPCSGAMKTPTDI